MDDISASQRNVAENAQEKDLCCILHQIASQNLSKDVTTSEFVTNILVGSIWQMSNLNRERQLTELGDQETMLNTDEFSCQKCFELLYCPVTLPCGHTYCQICVTQKPMKICVLCKEVTKMELFIAIKINIVLTNVLQKWYSLEYFGRSLVVVGLQMFAQGKHQECIPIFSQALEIIPNSFIATLHRAKAYYLLNKNDLALEDATRAGFLMRRKSEVYHVKSKILFKQQRFVQSLLAMLVCLKLDPQNNTATGWIHQITVKVIESLGLSTPNGLKLAAEEYKFGGLVKKRGFVESECSPSRKRKIFKKETDNSRDISSRRGEFNSPLPSAGSMDACVATNVPDLNEEESNIEKHRGRIVEDCLALPLSNYEADNGKVPVEDNLSCISADLVKMVDEILYDVDDKAQASKSSINSEEEKLDLKFPTKSRFFDSNLVNVSDFECVLCLKLLYNPVCTPCGHVFCQHCMERSLDHRPHCPLCKQCMKGYLAASVEKRHLTCDHVTKAIIEKYLPESYMARKQQHEVELAELQEMEPIFVCTVAFPSVVCPLHIFEPQYRLMLRRCLEYNECEFGMCLPDKDKGHNSVGTTLKIRNVTIFPDGRSIVDSVGSRRFVAIKSKVRDGYTVAKIIHITDKKPTNAQKLKQLCVKVYAEGKKWFDKLDITAKTRITNHYGKFPIKDEKPDGEDGPDWLWWILAILPVEDRIKVTVLGNNQLQQRLLIMHRIFTRLQLRNDRVHTPT